MSRRSRGYLDIVTEAMVTLYGDSFKQNLNADIATLAQVLRGKADMAKWDGVIDLLRKSTGKGKPIDPFEESDGTPWSSVSQLLSTFGERNLALVVSLEYLDTCYEIQKATSARIHKGGPHFWVSLRLWDYGQREASRAHLLLALIEDVVPYPDPRKAPAYRFLMTLHGMGRDDLDELIRFGKGYKAEFPLFPEQILVKLAMKKAARPIIDPWTATASPRSQGGSA